MAYISSKILNSLLISSFYFPYALSFGTYGFTVNVINGLPNSLALHCASKDDDFGFQHILANENYHWYFHRNFWLTTRYKCTFWWASKSARFDVFNYTISEECRFDKLNVDHNQCVWIVKEDGFYFGNQFPPQIQIMERRHDW